MLAVPKVQLPVTAKIIDGPVTTLPPPIVRDLLEQVLAGPEDPPIDWYNDKFNFFDRFRAKLKDDHPLKNFDEGERKIFSEGDYMDPQILAGIPMVQEVDAAGVTRRTDPFTKLWEKENLDHDQLTQLRLFGEYGWWGKVKNDGDFKEMYNSMKHTTPALKYPEMFCNVQVPFFGPRF